MRKIKHFIKNRRIASIFIALIIILLGYFIYSKLISTSAGTSYVVTNVKKGDITTNITGTGQVSASSQIEIKSKASGDLVYLNSKANGTTVAKGTLIAQIDTRDASITLETAKIAYEKALKPADTSTILQAENTLNSAIVSNKKSYEDALTAIVDTFVDMPTIILGLDSIYSGGGYLQTENVRSTGQTALLYQKTAEASFSSTKSNYNDLLDEFKTISRSSSTSTIEAFVEKTYILARNMSEALKNTQSTIEYVRDQNEDAEADTPSALVANWITTINADASSLLSSKTEIVSSFKSITQAEIDLDDLKNGLDSLDLRSEQLALLQKQNDYQNYFIRAPFEGLLAKLSVRPTDSVSSGTVIGTLVSKQKITSITLNEVDVSKVHVGQKAKLTFDAIEGLTIDGTVSAVDLVGVVTQGVVNYNVEIVLDTQDERIKSGMSVSASIITETKENVLVVPNSAIKSQSANGRAMSYIEVFSPALIVSKGPMITGIPSETPPQQKRVEIGISNDTNTEIVSGINEGDQIVIRTIAETAAKVTTPSILGGVRAPSGTANTRRAP